MWTSGFVVEAKHQTRTYGNSRGHHIWFILENVPCAPDKNVELTGVEDNVPSCLKGDTYICKYKPGVVLRPCGSTYTGV